MSPATEPTKKAGKPIAEMEPEELVKLYDDSPDIQPVTGAYRYRAYYGTRDCMCPMTMLAACRIAQEDQTTVEKAMQAIEAAAAVPGVGYSKTLSAALKEDQAVIGAFARGFDAAARPMRRHEQSDDLYDAIKAAYLLGGRVKARLNGRVISSRNYY